MTLTVTATANLAAAEPRVNLAVSSTPAVLGEVTVYRVHPDGERFRVLTNHGANVIAGTWVGIDYHFPFNVDITYVAEAAGQVSAPSAPVYYPSDVNWLTSPSGEGVPIPFLLGPAPKTVRKARTQRFDVLGRKRPVYQTLGPRSGVSSDLTVYCQSLDDAADVRSLLDAGGPLLLRTRGLAPDLWWAWMQPGDETFGSPNGRLAVDDREVSFPVEECEQPDFDTTPVWTIGELTAEGLTIAQVASIFGSVGALTFNVRS